MEVLRHDSTTVMAFIQVHSIVKESRELAVALTQAMYVMIQDKLFYTQIHQLQRDLQKSCCLLNLLPVIFNKCR